MKSSVRRMAAMALVAMSSFLCLTGFIEIRDEAIVKASGASVAKRTVSSPEAAELEKLLDDMRAKDPDPKARREAREFNEKFRNSICDAITERKKSWDTCRWDGTTLVVEKHYGRHESPFSSVENDTATFALHHWLSNAITRPPFPLVNIGPVMQDDEQHRAFIRDLRDKGFVLDLTVRMPGTITYLWGRQVKGDERSVHVDLLEPWPEELTETFVSSKRGLLYEEWVHMLIILCLTIGGLIWLRLAKR